MDKEFKGLIKKMSKHHSVLVIAKCLKLFRLRFKSDYEAMSKGKEYPYSYFNEWCCRIENGTAHGYADNITKKILIEVGI